MLAIVFALLLDSIICQMNEVIIELRRVDAVRLARCADVALLEEVDVHILREEHPDTDVKLPLVDEKGPFDVLLDDEG